MLFTIQEMTDIEWGSWGHMCDHCRYRQFTEEQRVEHDAKVKAYFDNVDEIRAKDGLPKAIHGSVSMMGCPFPGYQLDVGTTSLPRELRPFSNNH